MSADNRGKRPKEQLVTILKKLLGSLELQVMEFMWQAGEATVQQVVKTINRRRPIAYTTVMTVMGHLVDEGLLARAMVAPIAKELRSQFHIIQLHVVI